MNKMDLAIMRMKEMQLCEDNQYEVKSIEDSNIMLNIICNEVENE